MKSIIINLTKDQVEAIKIRKKLFLESKEQPPLLKVNNHLSPTAPYNPSKDDVRFYIYTENKVIGSFKSDYTQSFRTEVANWSMIAEAINETREDAIKSFNSPVGWLIRIHNYKELKIPLEVTQLLKPCIMPECPYCPSCEYGRIEHSPDEAECTADLEGAYSRWICTNNLTEPLTDWTEVQDIISDIDGAVGNAKKKNKQY